MSVMVFTVLALLGAPPSPPVDAARARPPLYSTMRIDYTGSLLGLPMMRATVQARLSGPRHSLRADFRSAGLAAMIKSLNVIAESQGIETVNGLQTLQYWHQENDGHKTRHVQMRYGDDAVQVNITPPLHSMGAPPASQTQRLEAMDPLSALLALTELAADVSGRRCHGNIRVFDGKQRYDLKLESLGMSKVSSKVFSGAAEKCAVYYVPVAGFDGREVKDPSAYAKPVFMWLAAAAGTARQVPVRFSFDAPVGRFIIKARRLTLDESGE